MHRLTARVRGRGIELWIPRDEVFIPNLMSWFSAVHMRVSPGESFCDVGVGSGLHAILAAKLGAARVYGTDINPAALRCARENAERNGVAGVCRFFPGSLIEPLTDRGIRVDVMIYNAPHFPGRSIERGVSPTLRRSVDGGPGGAELNAAFLARAGRALTPGGRIYNPRVAWSSPSRTREAVRAAGLREREVAFAHIPPWGRGNRTGRRLLDRPGRHVFRFEWPRGRDTRASLSELRFDPGPPLPGAEPMRVEITFSPEAASTAI